MSSKPTPIQPAIDQAEANCLAALKRWKQDSRCFVDEAIAHVKMCHECSLSEDGCPVHISFNESLDHLEVVATEKWWEVRRLWAADRTYINEGPLYQH